MGPIEAELRGRAYGEGKFNVPNSKGAWRVYEGAHRELMIRHTGSPIGVYVGCCVEAMSEAIEAAEALNL